MTANHVLGVCIALCFAMGLEAQAQTLYKLIDKNGKVTYAEKPPKDFDGKVIRLDIDPNANTATLPKPVTPPAGNADSATPDRLKAARDRAEAARKAYDNALNNPGESDVTRVGNVGGGTRPVFSEAYAKRLAELEQAAKEAEDDLKRAERG
ncbi:MAG: DUF4124 domain-containing protein [Usitatibacter sp.]